MRPVNLLPPEERRDKAAAGRAGIASYLIVAVLALAVIGVTATVLIGNGIDDKKAEVAALEQQESEAAARAQSLASFASFQQITDDRAQTISALAASRFDWRRVMEELARVIPPRVWLVTLAGQVTGAAENAEAEITGPSLEMTGCARSQRDVARMIGAVEDIDGVTRVTVTRSEKSDGDGTGAAAPATDANTNEDCRTRNYIAQFDLVAAFDAVDVPEGATPPAPEPDPAPESEGTPASGTDGGAGEAQQAREDGAGEVAEAEGSAQSAANIASGGGG